LGLLDRFRKKKKIEVETKEIITELEQFCGNDKETYEALHNTMFLDPTKIGIPMRDAAENAKKFEKERDVLKTRTWYEIAGGLAIYEGNVKKVVEFFTECERISPETRYSILKNPEKAVEKAQEYYKKHLKA
jgi:hypothetical protein